MINIVIKQNIIEKKIFLIRGLNIMLAKDLAELYGVETKYLIRQVRRNIERFPEDFMFQLTREEFLRCQNATSSELVQKIGKDIKNEKLAYKND